MPEPTVVVSDVQPSGDGQGNTTATVQSSSVGAAAAPAMTPQPQPKKYYATIYPGPLHPLPDPFVKKILALEETLGMPLWLFIQDEDGPTKYDDINEDVRKGFWFSRSQMHAGSPIALLIDSPGGYAKNAYQIPTLLLRHLRQFTTALSTSPIATTPLMPF